MENPKLPPFLTHFLLGLVFLGVIVLAGIYVFPLLNWGKIELTPAQTILVTGEAKSQEKTQIASFTAGVTAVNDTKNTATSEVNKKMEEIIAAVKTFGIPEADIKTQDLSVYQTEETYYQEGVPKARPGQWRANNSIIITLRDVTQASALADLLTKTGATNVSGPNFTVDDTKTAEAALLEEAIKDAQSKAGLMAKASGRRLGKILSVTEGSSQTVPIYRAAFEGIGGGGAPVEPGSQTIYKTVTVTFALK